MSELALANKPKRVPLKALPAAVFQHPLDRQATESLKRVRGFDWLVGKFIEYGFERIDYISNVGGSIRVGPAQMSKHYAMLRECCDILDVPEPELYVMQGDVNAFTSGHNHPFIILKTGLLELLDNDDEVMFVIAHELGHIKCGHVLYNQMARAISPVLEIVGGSVPVVGKFVGSGIEAGLLTWSRRSELSADRAGLLVMQDPAPCISALMKMAGGTERHVEWLDPQQFLLQARAYKEGLDQKVLDRFYRFIVSTRATHPFPVERARTLDEWVNTQEYKDILLGKYAIPATLPTDARACPTCGWHPSPGDMFCLQDGTPLRPH